MELGQTVHHHDVDIIIGPPPEELQTKGNDQLGRIQRWRGGWMDKGKMESSE